MQHKFLIDGYARNKSGIVYEVIYRTDNIVILRRNKRVCGRYIKTDEHGNEYAEYSSKKPSTIWPMC